MKIDYSTIDDIVIEGINTADFPDFCDSFILSCDIDGRPATEEELNFLNEDSMFVYECVCNQLF